MRLSENYKLSEFAVSDTAAKRGIYFTVPENYVPHVRALVDNLLQPISSATGWTNVISSGYRPPNVNSMVGGVDTSMHLVAEAADCNFNTGGRKVAPIDVAEKVLALQKAGVIKAFDQMILYPTFVHLSYTARRANRNQVLYSSTYRGRRVSA